MKINLIQENTKEVPWFTSLVDVAKWLGIRLDDYSWHISDVEVDKGWVELEDPCWISGKSLASQLEQYNYQFIWAVLSAFPKEFEPVLSNEPYADGNPHFWKGVPEKQLEASLFEIVCWDSTCTLFIDLPEDLSKNLIENAPGIKDLNKENEMRLNRKQIKAANTKL